jgi:diguanylate cyclase (GGDEF)-like protein/PAS domain S-box-containing protein
MKPVRVDLARGSIAHAGTSSARPSLLASLLESSPDGIVAFDRDLCCTLWNGAMERLSGIDRRQAIGRSILDCIPSAGSPSEPIVREALAGIASNRESCYLVAGQPRHVEECYAPLTDGHGAVVGGVVTVRDVTGRRQREEQLTRQAFYDALTGLPNRVLFLDRLGHALTSIARRPGGLAVLFVDLDDFKRINDTFGHQAGDQVLAAVGARLVQCLRPDDTVARFGGDEFVVLLRQTMRLADAVSVVERLLELFRHPVTLADGRSTSVGASIGIALTTSHDPAVSAEEIIRQADVALYRAKTGGKARYAADRQSIVPTMRAAA